MSSAATDMMNMTMNDMMMNHTANSTMNHNMTHGAGDQSMHNTTTGVNHTGHSGHGDSGHSHTDTTMSGDTMDNSENNNYNHGAGGDDTMMHTGHGATGTDTNTFCTPMGHGTHGSGNDSAGMIMYMDGFRFSLHESSPCLNLYFPGWTLDTRGKFAGAMIGIVLLAVLTEGLSMIRFKLQNSFKSQPQRRRWVLTGVHGLQALTGYILMLATMTFSIELLLCVILGLGLGYGLFYNEGDTHVTTNPCCNFIQSEANERETRLHTDDHCEHEDEDDDDKRKNDAAPESAVEGAPSENV